MQDDGKSPWLRTRVIVVAGAAFDVEAFCISVADFRLQKSEVRFQNAEVRRTSDGERLRLLLIFQSAI